MDLTLRKATTADAGSILELVNGLAADQIMLPRSPASVIENIRDFVIAEADGEFAGCGALHIVWSHIAEIRSIAVPENQRKTGLGRRMVEHMIEEAETLGIARVFAFTYVPDFFKGLGFAVVEHASLPHKVFQDCLNCPKFQQCDEVAVERVLHDIENDPVRGPLSRPLPGVPLPIIGR